MSAQGLTHKTHKDRLLDLVEQTGLDREALEIIYDEYGNRRRFEVLNGRMVEKSIKERSSHYSERTELLFHLKSLNPRNQVGNSVPVRLPDRELYFGDVVAWRPETPMVGEPEHFDGFHGVPDLFVEVVASWKAERDADDKRRHCAACGVPHFWVADLRQRRYYLYSRPEGDAYTELTELTERAALRLPPELA
ncbi:MAG TPA: Uma2 family endonuclease [Chloroflexota bacterium]|nr:Uma2 family endonuclease [Chloroflexota bacterium]